MRKHSTMMIFLAIILACASAQDINWINSAIVQEELGKYVDDIHTINNNLEEQKVLFDLMANQRPENYTSASYMINNLESWKEPKDECEYIIAQMLVTMMDIDDKITIGELEIVRTNDRAISISMPGLSESVSAFAVNRVFNCSTNESVSSEVTYVNSKGFQRIPEDGKILSKDRKQMLQQIKTFSNFSRVHWFDVDTSLLKTPLSSAALQELEETFTNDLTYTSWYFLEKVLYAAFDMIDHQLISAVAVNAVSNPLEKSVIILMQQVQQISERISALPLSVNVGGAVGLTADFDQKDLETQLSALSKKIWSCTEDRDDDEATPIKCMRVDCNYVFKEASWATGTAVQKDVTLPFKIRVENATFSLVLVGAVESESLDLNRRCAVDESPYVRWYGRDLQYRVKWGARLYISDAIAPPTSASGGFKFTTGETVMTLSDPQPFEEEADSGKKFGLAFSISTEQEALANFSISTTRVDIPDGWAADCERETFEVDNITTYVGCYNDGSSSLAAPCDYVLAIPVTKQNIAVSPTLTAIAGDLLFGYETASEPIYYEDSLSDIETYLQFLSTEVSDLKSRVASLEAINEMQNVLMIVDFIPIGAGGVDFLKNTIAKSSLAKKLILPIKQAFTRISKAVKGGVGDEVRDLSRALIKERSTSYDVAEALNAGAVFNFQHGRVKNEWAEEAMKKLNLKDLDMNLITAEGAQDLRELMQLSAGVYAQVQRKMRKLIGESEDFGQVLVHSSPIEQLPVVGKFLHDFTADSDGARAFLTNTCTRFPFHTSVSIRSFDIEKDGQYVLEQRFTGIGEPSIVGPTTNPRQINVGYVKVQWEVSRDGQLTLRNWDKTKIANSGYTKEDIDRLYYAFSRKKVSSLTTDEKWELIVAYTTRRVNTLNIIDRAPVQNGIFLDTIDDIMWFSKAGNSFKYNLFNNNCQNFALNLATFVSTGQFKYAMVASDWEELATLFEKYASNYFTMAKVARPAIDHFQNTIVRFG